MNLNQVSVLANDLSASVAFYQLLGLELIVLNDHYARFEVPHGEATFSLMLASDQGQVASVAGAHIYFECDDLDGEVRRLKAAGVVFDSGPVDQNCSGEKPG